MPWLALGPPILSLHNLPQDSLNSPLCLWCANEALVLHPPLQSPQPVPNLPLKPYAHIQPRLHFRTIRTLSPSRRPGRCVDFFRPKSRLLRSLELQTAFAPLLKLQCLSVGYSDRCLVENLLNLVVVPSAALLLPPWQTMATAPDDTDSDVFLQATPDSQALERQSLDLEDGEEEAQVAQDVPIALAADKPYQPLNAGTPIRGLLAIIPRAQGRRESDTQLEATQGEDDRGQSSAPLKPPPSSSTGEVCLPLPKAAHGAEPPDQVYGYRNSRAKPSTAPHLRSGPESAASSLSASQSATASRSSALEATAEVMTPSALKTAPAEPPAEPDQDEDPLLELPATTAWKIFSTGNKQLAPCPFVPLPLATGRAPLRQSAEPQPKC